MSALCLDVGTYSIKAVSGHPGLKPEVERVIELFNELGLSIPSEEAQIVQLSEKLATTIADNKLPTKDVRLALPESAVSTKIIELPRLTDAELGSAIDWQAEQYIPIPPDELSLEYKVLYRPPAKETGVKMRVLLVGARRSVIERFLEIFNRIGIEPRVLETQVLSVLRTLQIKPEEPTSLLIHLGAATMTLAVINQGELAFVFNHMNGSQMLTRALEQGVGLTTKQAEQYKRSYGLDETQFEGKVKAALLPAANVIVDALQKAMRFFANQHQEAGIQRILLSGGGVQLPGFAQYLSNQLGVEVLVVAPFANASGKTPDRNQSALSVCMGLLMREL
ncbi:MAG: hypothetical protein COU69_00980 [Candidatus Pacebacteria bacterium CG10_big_fil_rev_8_21_14_0_10_56_10]|nr:MAG: hypothetical protein COU69_00980 [Candidatus Pacebacteria bacterium CG10_big_fil_rev_8_21_14_0_10_56_10]